MTKELKSSRVLNARVVEIQRDSREHQNLNGLDSNSTNVVNGGEQ